ncbi:MULTISPECIES: hypothetical protein [unclassified Blautia]|uniref:hypothetical protein n=1 Tax=unclassified Blautia TaxID=2648079 RepID=UPI003F8BB0B5
MAENDLREERTVVLSREEQLNMERCAEFMARMIQKYGKKVLAKIEAKERAERERELVSSGDEEA